MSLTEIIDIPQQEIPTIQNVISEIGEQASKFKPVYEYQEGGADSKILGCVMAAMEIAKKFSMFKS